MIVYQLLSKLQELRTDLGNFHILHYRMVDGFLVSAKNSGTHWLRFMLSAAIASRLRLPPPSHSSGPNSDVFVGHPKWPHIHTAAPRIGSSHTIPSALIAWLGRQRLLALPPTVVLVRDIRDALVSVHVKWGYAIRTPLSDFVRRPPLWRDPASAWWFLRFFNHWGDMAEVFGDRILVVRYEDLQAAPGLWIARIGAHYGIQFDSSDVAAALAVADRESIRERLDPDYGEAVVPDQAARRAVRLSADDEHHLLTFLRANLRHDFGYGYLQSEDRSIIQ
jgi:hypothetical protein